MDEKLKKQLDEQWEIERYNREKDWEIEKRIERKEFLQYFKQGVMILLGMFALIGLIYLTIAWIAGEM